MQYPIWFLPNISGGVLIAIISVIHVFVAQFAVGGAFYLVLAERKAMKERNLALFNWVADHTVFFLLLTMVFGGVTGVGIWLSVSTIVPEGLLLLLNEFAFIWAAEWSFFLGEIIALLVYANTFSSVANGTMSARNHQIIGWIYAFFAFGSLFIINGIIAFMLTPGKWLETSSLYDGFFNPTFWPALFFRFALCLMLAGLFGLARTYLLNKSENRTKMTKWSAVWVCITFVFFAAFAAWYVIALPDYLQDVLLRRTEDMRPFVKGFLITLPVLFIAGLMLCIKLPSWASNSLIVLLFVAGFSIVATFEWVREGARRPWLVYGYMYSNGIIPKFDQALKTEGLLSKSKWAQIKVAHAELDNIKDNPVVKVDAKNDSANLASVPVYGNNNIEFINISLDPKKLSEKGQFAYGEYLYRFHCFNCHGFHGPAFDLVPRVKALGKEGVEAVISGMGVISPYMPIFYGTDADKDILSSWLTQNAIKR